MIPHYQLLMVPCQQRSPNYFSTKTTRCGLAQKVRCQGGGYWAGKDFMLVYPVRLLYHAGRCRLAARSRDPVIYRKALGMLDIYKPCACPQSWCFGSTAGGSNSRQANLFEPPSVQDFSVHDSSDCTANEDCGGETSIKPRSNPPLLSCFTDIDANLCFSAFSRIRLA